MDLKSEKNNINKPLEELSSCSLKCAQEGIVLLKNKQHLLPLSPNCKIALFGRMIHHYYKSGTGSGGLVNTMHVPSIYEVLKTSSFKIDKEIEDIYLSFENESPFDEGNGMWASEPWSQKELLIDEKIILESALRNDVAIFVIARTSGEDKDNKLEEGSLCLQKIEEEMLRRISLHYKKIIVILNVGNIIDMSFVDKYSISAVLYAFHGGEHGAQAILDVVSGVVNPSGKLTTTIPCNLNDYPINVFQSSTEVFYSEDIYVGYRYHYTFNPQNILYPFGFGLSYAKFQYEVLDIYDDETQITIKVQVQNISQIHGKEVMQLYFENKGGKIKKPKRVLIAYQKTKLLMPNEKQVITLSSKKEYFSSFDDLGVIKKDHYILDKGLYKYYLGTSLLNVKKIYESHRLKPKILKKGVGNFNVNSSLLRLENNKGKPLYFKEEVVGKTIKNDKRKYPTLYEDSKFYTFEQLKNNEITLDDFVSSLSNVELSHLIQAEGMSSSKVTPGLAGVFGGISKSLSDRKIPLNAMSDGPSGIRIDSGLIATSLPNGTSLAAAFNTSLIEQLYFLVAKEMKNYQIDTLLAPGLNIHRTLLNGRNFEYFSEDPLVSGLMAKSVILGLKRGGVNGVLKHLALNNQETNRFVQDSIVSNRAIREIYLRPFEIAIKEAKPNLIMTSYNKVNGIYAASNYTLINEIIRKEFKYKGLVITDWWARLNDEESREGNKTNLKAMIKAGGDIYCVDQNVETKKHNIISSLFDHSLSRLELIKSAKRIITFLLNYEKSKSKKIIDPILSLPLTLFINDKEVEIKDGKRFYTLNEKIKKIEVKTNLKYQIKKKKNGFTLIVFSDDLETYYFTNIEKRREYKELELSMFKRDKFKIIDDALWKENIINLDEYAYKDERIVVTDSIKNCVKNSVISYGLKINSYGKYIVNLTLTCQGEELSQVPLTIFVDEVRKSTLTFNYQATPLETTAFILIDKGEHFLTFKFNKTGINILRIKIIKHG